ncbi:hypothetical protein KCU91_g14563, partial [Aureobasidium melanogenum]
MAQIRGSPSKDAERQTATETGVRKKTPVKSAAKRGRNTTTSPPPTARSSRPQPRVRRPSVKLANTNTDEHIRNRSRPLQAKDPLRPLAADISSDNLVETPVPKAKLPRNYLVANSKELSPPWIACSGFVPPAMIEFLMRCKKRTTLAVKFKKGDKIINMEGAMHTFITSLELAWLHGKRGHDKGHTFTPYLPSNKFRRGRQVLISNMIHQDFETDEVMMKLASLTKTKTTLIVDFNIPTTEEKQSEDVRKMYDDALRRLMVYNLVLDGELLSVEAGSAKAMSRAQARSFLANKVLKADCSNVLEQVRNRLFWLSATSEKEAPLLSLELLVATAYHQS